MLDRIKAAAGDALAKWNGIEASRRVRIIIIAAVFLVALGITVYLTLRPAMYVLVNNQDAATIVSAQGALDSAGIASELAENGTALRVNSRDLGQARLALETANVFSGNKFTYYDALEYSSMGTTDTIKNENLKKAKQTELEGIIGKMRGVRAASVQLVIPGDTNFFLPEAEATAAVLVETDGQLDAGQAEAVARFVARSVKNLDVSNVEITDQNYNMLFSGGSAAAGGGIKTQFEAESLMKSALEDEIKRAARPLFDETSIIFNLRFNWDTISEQSRTYTNPLGDEAASGFTDSEKTSKSSSSGTAAGGEPGVGANNQETPTYVMQGGETSASSLNEKEASYIYNVVEQNKTGQIGNMLAGDSSMSVYVYRYAPYAEADMKAQGKLDGTTWADFKADTKPSEFTVDQNFAESLKMGTGIKNLSVVGYMVPVFTDAPPPAPMALSQIVTMAALALLIILLAYGLLRRAKPVADEEIEPELSVEELLMSGQPEEPSRPEPEKLSEIEIGLESDMRRQLDKLVDEKPEAAAALMRNWLNDDWE
ncbi:MAG: hypothetical protein LBK41_03795 [Clostridiales bacterium]|jgi:flagellar M-ring protein FliF|nr:hypothetical protein [Clostridiales bacterium]